jgi:hypothetical protein
MTPPLIPRVALFGNPARTSPQLSLDGRSCAYLAPDERQVQQVWLRPIARDDGRPLTTATTRGRSRLGSSAT